MESFIYSATNNSLKMVSLLVLCIITIYKNIGMLYGMSEKRQFVYLHDKSQIYANLVKSLLGIHAAVLDLVMFPGCQICCNYITSYMVCITVFST